MDAQTLIYCCGGLLGVFKGIHTFAVMAQCKVKNEGED